MAHIVKIIANVIYNWNASESWWRSRNTHKTLFYTHTHRQTVGVGHIYSILSWSGPQSLHHTKEIKYWLLWIWGCHSGELRLLTMVGVVMSVPVSIYICMCNVARLVIAFICVPHSFLAGHHVYVQIFGATHSECCKVYMRSLMSI